MDKPLKIIIIGILYILGGIGLIVLSTLIVVVTTMNPMLIIGFLNLIFRNGGFFAGDTFINVIQIYYAINFLVPMFFITSPLSIVGGILLMTTNKKIAWYLAMASSILYCLVIIGLIVDWILIQENVREIYKS